MSYDPERAAYIGRKIAAFLADDDIKALFEQLDRDAYNRFRTARTEPQRLSAWAFSQALTEVMASLTGAVDAGEMVEPEA